MRYLFTLQTEAEFKVEERKTIEIAKNGIAKGYNNDIIADLTKLSLEKIEELRKEFKK